MLVIGGTGRVGRYLIQKLVQRGIEVKALVRDRPRDKVVEGFDGVEIIKGSVEDFDAMKLATKDCVSVIDVHGVSPPRFSKFQDLFVHPKNSPNHPHVINYLGTKLILEAMKLNGVTKLVRVTGALAGASAFNPVCILFNMLLSMTVLWHYQSEVAIKQSGLDYTCIRPCGLRNEPTSAATNKTLVLFSEDQAKSKAFKTKSSMSVEDLAELCVLCGSEMLLSRKTVTCTAVETDGVKETVQPLTSDWMELIHRVSASTPSHANETLHNASLFVTCAIFAWYLIMMVIVIHTLVVGGLSTYLSSRLLMHSFVISTRYNILHN